MWTHWTRWGDSPECLTDAGDHQDVVGQARSCQNKLDWVLQFIHDISLIIQHLMYFDSFQATFSIHLVFVFLYFPTRMSFFIHFLLATQNPKKQHSVFYLFIMLLKIWFKFINAHIHTLLVLYIHSQGLHAWKSSQTAEYVVKDVMIS